MCFTEILHNIDYVLNLCFLAQMYLKHITPILSISEGESCGLSIFLSVIGIIYLLVFHTNIMVYHAPLYAFVLPKYNDLSVGCCGRAAVFITLSRGPETVSSGGAFYSQLLLTHHCYQHCYCASQHLCELNLAWGIAIPKIHQNSTAICHFK